MEVDGLDFKERLVAERKAPPPLKALAGEGEPAGAPGGAAWAHMRQRLARAEREARSARRLAIALFGASVAGMAGILRVALPWSVARTAELATRATRVGAAPAWAGTARDPLLPGAVPASASPVPGQMPTRFSDPAHPPVLPSGAQSLGAKPLIAGSPPALAPAPSALPAAKPAGATLDAHPVSQPVAGDQPITSRPQLGSSPGVSGSRSAGSHSGVRESAPALTQGSGSSRPNSRPHGLTAGFPAVAAKPEAHRGRIPHHAPQPLLHGLPSTVRRPPSPVQPRRLRRALRLSSYRAPAASRQSRWSTPYRAHPRRWRVLRVATRHGAAYCLVDPQGHWWVARRAYPRGFRRAGAWR